MRTGVPRCMQTPDADVDPRSRHVPRPEDNGIHDRVAVGGVAAVDVRQLRDDALQVNVRSSSTETANEGSC